MQGRKLNVKVSVEQIEPLWESHRISRKALGGKRSRFLAE